MIDHARSFSLFLVIGLFVTWINNLLESDFISGYLSENLITLLIALVAINTTTLSIILTKLRELKDKNGGNFTQTINDMKESIIEQIFLIIGASITQVLRSSRLIQNSWSASDFISQVVLVAIFSSAIQILYDTANGIFILLNYENKEV